MSTPPIPSLLKPSRNELITVASNCSNKEYGGLEIDESYFGVRKTRKKIRRTAGTIPFDLFKKK